MATIKFGSSTIDKLMLGSTEVVKIYLGSNTIYEGMEQLDTPTNLSASGTSVTFDEVTNATSYEVFADGLSIGVYEPSSWEQPIQEGSQLTVTQTYLTTQSSSEITIE